MTFRPMLAYNVGSTSLLEFPLIASPKLDGIRCVIWNGGPRSRSLKAIPNRYVQEKLTGYPPFDGELIVGDPLDPSAFNKSTRGIMSHGGKPDFRLWVFDLVAEDSHEQTFEERLGLVKAEIARWPWAVLVPQKKVYSIEALNELEATYVALGYEGIMVRSPDGHYKFGRSTPRQGLLGKIKRFEDTEGTIIGFEELEHNGNEAKTNILGLTERSHSKNGKTLGGQLGALLVKHEDWQEPFGLGTGFTANERFWLWQNRSLLVGKRVKFKHQVSGAKDRPRFPVYLGIRED